MDNLKILLAITVDKTRGDESGAILERLVKPRASKHFGDPVYFLDGPGLSFAISGPYEEFFNIAFRIWIGGNIFQMVAADQSVCTTYGGP